MSTKDIAQTERTLTLQSHGYVASNMNNRLVQP